MHINKNMNININMHTKMNMNTNININTNMNIREEEQEQLQRELEAKALKLQLAKKGDAKAPIGGGVKKKISAAALAAQTAALSLAGGGGDDDNDSDYDEEELDRKEKEQNMTNEMNERDGSRSRKVIQFLISKWPEALVTDNNFLATPVETVLEKSRRIKSLSRRISIFGLFDDPPTARLLLNAQKYRAEKRLLPPLRPRFFSTLRELNWLARRDAVLLSSIGEKRTIGNTDNSGKIRLTVGGNSTSTAKTKQKNKSESKTQFQKEKDKMKDKDKNTNTNKESLEGDDKNDNGECHTIIVTVCGDEDIPKNNILARFRRRGHMDIVRQVVAWI